jgi:hypothetical protein
VLATRKAKLNNQNGGIGLTSMPDDFSLLSVEFIALAVTAVLLLGFSDGRPRQ